MKNTLLAISGLILAGSQFSTFAQNDLYGNTGGVPSRVIMLAGDSAKLDGEMEAILYDTKDLNFQDPRAPRFLFVDTHGNTALGIGGYVEGVMQYDFNGAIDGNGFTTYDIPVPRDPSMLNRFGADVTHSTIFLRLLRKTGLGVLQAYVQTNFTGNNGGYGVTVKQAYMKLGGVTAGLTNSTFVDNAAGVPTIDYEGPSGSIGAKNVLVQYAHKFNSHWSGAISLESNTNTYTTDAQSEKISQRCPDIPAYVQYSWGDGNDHVRLSGIYRNLSYRNLVKGENRSVSGYGVQISGIATPVPMVTLYYQAAYGKGIARYINDLAGNGYDLVATGDGRMTAPEDLGVVGGIQFNLTDNFFVSGSYSLNRTYGDGAMGGLGYRRADYYVANAFYSFMDGFQAGVEYVHGNRYDRNMLHNSANRVECMLKYSF